MGGTCYNDGMESPVLTDAPSTAQLFAQLHRHLGVVRTPPDVSSSDEKIRLYGVMEKIFEQWRREEFSRRNMNKQSYYRKLRGTLRAAHTRKEFVNMYLLATKNILTNMFTRTYVRHKRHGAADTAATRTATTSAIDETDAMLRDRDCDVDDIPGMDEPFLYVAGRGLNTQRGLECGLTEVISRVALEKHGYVISEEEHAEIDRNNIGILKSLATTHIEILSCIRPRLQTVQEDVRDIRDGDAEPFDVEPFILVRRSGRLTMDITEEAVESVRRDIEERRETEGLLENPMVGCAAASIVAALHRLFHHGFVRNAVNPLLRDLDRLPLR